MVFFDNFTEETQSSLKRAFMECSIIFTVNKDESVNALKGKMFLQAVLALLVEAGVPCTANQMHNIYYKKTGKQIDENQFDNAFKQLYNLTRWRN